MSGFNDGSCHKCGARIGWVGAVVDMPNCHKCGAAPKKADLKATSDELDRLREELAARAQAEWDARTPEQEQAFEAGRQDYQAWLATAQDGYWFSFKREKARERGFVGTGLERWHAKGWTAEEFA